MRGDGQSFLAAPPPWVQVYSSAYAQRNLIENTMSKVGRGQGRAPVGSWGQRHTRCSVAAQ